MSTDQRFGGYRVIRELGRGGMGVVYLAHDPRLDRQVAIKTLTPELSAKDALERFAQEARTLARLNHPNVAAVYDVGEHEGVHFLVMELVAGETLQDRLRRGRLPTGEALELAVQVAEGLAAAHAHHVVHRDLKPGNVMRTADGRVKILDFGLAKTVEGERAPVAGDDPTLEMHVMGTVGYMSPEQLRGRPLDVRSDVFAFGALLYEMMTGRRPFEGASPADIAAATLAARPAPVRDANPEVPPELERLLEHCLAKDPRDRYPSAAAVLEALRPLRPAAGAGAGPPSVAVLPFSSLSADPENEYFADGIAEEIIGALCRVDALRVAARTSSFAFKGRAEDVRKIGRDLDVTAVLEGSVRRSGNRLRVTAQLVKSTDGYHLWSAKFDRDLQDVFAVQDEIAENIASALSVVLGESERKAIRRLRTTNPEAHDWYLRGLAALRQVTADEFRKAERYFRQAVELDPEYALAWAGLAEAQSWVFDWIEKNDAVVRSMDSASLRAVELDPELPEAHVARGQALVRGGRMDEARREFDEAIRLNPRGFEGLYYRGRTHMHDGDVAEAAEYFLKAADARPEDYQSLALATSCLMGLGRHDEKRKVARRCLDVIEKHLVLHPDDVRAVYLGAGAWSAVGERARALEWCRRAIELRDDDSTRFNVACVYANEGQIEEAIDLVERSVDGGWGNRSWIEHDPDMRPLRDHPRFQAMLQRMDSRIGG